MADADARLHRESDELLFMEETNEPESEPVETPAGNNPWKVMVIDDDREVHHLTELVLKDFIFEGRSLTLINGYSAADARRLAQEHPDTALMILDVVMETDDAGLNVVRFIRENLGNRLLRIILRTGQADQAPENRVVVHYDINDYKEKADLSVQKMITAVTTGLRGFRDLRRIEHLAQSKEALERRVAERTRELSRANDSLQEEVKLRQEAVIELQKSQGSLARAQAVARLGAWEWDLETNELTWSDELRRIMGREPQETDDPYACLIRSAHPDDRERVKRAMNRSLEEREPFDLEYRVVRDEGDERIVHLLGEVSWDDGLKPRRMVGAVHDITERKKTEEQLQIATRVFTSAMSEVEGQFSITAQVFESAIEGVIVTDDALVIQSVNPAFTRITGFTPDEAKGQTLRILRSDHHDESFYQEMVKTLRKSGRWQGEVWSRRKGGEAFPEQRTMTAIRSIDGEIASFVVVSHDISDIKRSQEQLFYKTYHDALTGLPNRVLFNDRLEQAVHRAHQTSGQLATLIFGLDLFKNVNDSLGYATGDRLLQEVSKRLEGCIEEDDTVCRLGGDEFGFILGGAKNVRAVVAMVQRIFEALSKPFVLQDHELYVTASIGISLYPNDGEEPSALMKSADMAMNRAKDAGRNHFQFYTPAMDEAAARRLALESKLRKGIERGEFVLYYQPKVEIATGQVVGCEALVRWNQPEIGMVSPGEFIPLSEETGLIVPLGEWILLEACRTMKRWVDQGFAMRHMAVNLSARQFQQAALVHVIRSALEETGLASENLELEITESMVMGDVERAISKMNQMKEMGIRIAMDDFGAGYSSLTYLKRFPIHALKIDQSFVRDLAEDADDAAIVEAIIAMARAMGLRVVAEGVETPEQLDFLRRKSSDEIQGYYFSPPLPADEFERLIREGKKL